jgi:anti-sigma regulatory factor (Ser/Thr protein kinase)
VTVAESSQPSAARYAAHDAAETAGFDEEDIHRAGLVATELATNLLKHATGGEILVRSAGKRPGEVEILSIDRGPGMADVSRSLSDGHSTSGSSGTGLGAVRRLSDDFDIYSERGKGTVILARVRARRAARPAALALDVAGISIAKPGESVCGDAWQVYHHVDGALIAVVDGLGHGVHANEASAAAIAAIDPRRAVGLPGILEEMHGRLRHTRGAAAAVADVSPRAQHMKFAGVGNISGVLFSVAASRRAVSLAGTLGHEARQFREFSYPWEDSPILVMYSDGLSSHWSLDAYRGLRQRSPAIIAAVLYRDFNRQRDDVTVVVAREASQ